MVFIKIAIIHNDVELSGGKDGFEAEADVLNEVSAVKAALKKLGHEVIVMSLSSDIAGFVKVLTAQKPDLVFNLVESVFGSSVYEMNFTALLGLLRIPFTGSSPAAIAISSNKATAKKILKFHNIPTPDFAVIDSSMNIKKINLNFPVFLKPLFEDGSIGIDNDSITADAKDFKRAVKRMVEKFKFVLAEDYIDGREFNVSVLGNDEPEILPISEIDYSKMPPGLPKILGYRAKWIKDSPEYIGSIPVCPAKISNAANASLRQYALDVYRNLGLEGYGRIDFRMNGRGKIFVIDVNPNPCISPDAGFVRSAQAGGLDYTGLIEKILSFAFGKWQKCDNNAGLLHASCGV